MTIFYSWVCKYRLSLLSGLLLFLCQATCSGQGNAFLEPSMSYGTFSMREVKDFQKHFIEQVPVGIKITDSFPGFYLFGFRGAKALEQGETDNVYLGFVAETGSTGGRAHYADYSGSIHFDQLLRYFSGGIFLEKIAYQGPIHFFYGMQLEALQTHFTFKSHVKIGHQEDWQSEAFRSMGGALKPYLGVAYPMHHFTFGLHLGYLVNGSAPFHVKGEPKAIITLDGSENKVSPGWSGLRFNLSARYFLKI